MNMVMLMAEPISPALQEALDIIKPILMIIMVLLSIALIIIILSQKGNSGDITAISGGGGNQNAFMGKNKTSDRASRLKKWTYIIGGVMLLTSVAYFILQLIGRQ